MKWGDEIRFTAVGRIAARCGRAAIRCAVRAVRGAIRAWRRMNAPVNPDTLRWLSGWALHGTRVAAVIAAGLWFGWVSVIHPIRVERALARIEALSIRTDGRVWVGDDRSAAQRDAIAAEITHIADELRMYRVEVRSAMEKYARDRGIALPDTARMRRTGSIGGGR